MNWNGMKIKISWNWHAPLSFGIILISRKFQRLYCHTAHFHAILAKVRESNVFTKEITKEMIWRNIFSVRVNFWNYHTAQCDKMKHLYTLTKKTFRQMISLVISFVKTLLSRDFCQKWVRPSVIYSHRKNISSNHLYSKLFI